ncbi:MAG: hypothetical protein R3A48_06945 [Polyangiales bacterium]
MLTPAAFVLLALTGDPLSGDALARRLVLDAPFAGAQTFTLREPSLDDRAAHGRRRWLAQVAPRRAEVAAATSDDRDGSCEISCLACRVADQQAREVLRRRRSATSLHRAFALATWASMLATEVFGTLEALNADTWFARGPCASGRGEEAILGSYGCSGVRGMHMTFTLLTTGLYATTGVLAATAPDPERVSEGDDRRARNLRVHRALTWVHAAGMILLPILSVLASNPEVVVGAGADAAGTREDLSRAMRSVRQIVGYTTFGAYSVAAIYGFM